MGHDQGNVPVINIVIETHRILLARTGLYLFAFLLFLQPLTGDDNVPVDRCGFGGRATENRIRRGNDVEIQGTRPPLPLYAESADRRFRVHFTLKGTDAVDSADLDDNGTPDYVDDCLRALDRSWKLEVDTLGYAAPPDDDTTGGSRAIDVYLRDLGREGYYGITNLDRLLSLTPAERYTTWMEMDNNFSPTDTTWSGKQSYSTFGIDALRVTCAHELHHVIQNGSYGFSVQHRMIYELTSTWMEMRAFPEVRDWAIWTSYLLTRPELWPFSKVNALNGYCWGWFGNVLTSGSTDIMRSTWDGVAQGTEPFNALISACAASGTSITDLFCESLTSLYQTGKRGGINTYIPGASLLPEIKYASDVAVDQVAETITASVRPFEIRALRATVPSRSGEPVSMEQVISWTSSPSILFRPDSSLQTTMLYTPNPLPNDETIPNSSWGIRHSPSEVLCRYSSGTQLLATEAPYPQPFAMSSHEILHVPVSGAPAGSSVRIQVCDLSLRPLTSELSARLDIHNNRLVAQYQFSRKLEPGIYIVTVARDNAETILHKLVVER